MRTGSKEEDKKVESETTKSTRALNGKTRSVVNSPLTAEEVYSKISVFWARKTKQKQKNERNHAKYLVNLLKFICLAILCS